MPTITAERRDPNLRSYVGGRDPGGTCLGNQQLELLGGPTAVPKGDSEYWAELVRPRFSAWFLLESIVLPGGRFWSSVVPVFPVQAGPHAWRSRSCSSFSAFCGIYTSRRSHSRAVLVAGSLSSQGDFVMAAPHSRPAPLGTEFQGIQSRPFTRHPVRRAILSCSRMITSRKDLSFSRGFGSAVLVGYQAVLPDSRIFLLPK